MTALPVPHLSRRRTLPLVWIVPILALVVGGWMLAREFRQRGPEITIDFDHGAGVKAGATVLEYKGVAVGLVRAVELAPDLGGVRVRVRLDRAAAALARQGTEFWIVQPEIGFSGIRGLDTLLTGVRLRARPGQGPPASRFRGLERPPPVENPAVGREFELRADRLGSVNPGAPVYYREVKVGAVETSRLADDASAVLIRIRIRQPYVDLIRINTRFWNAGGATFRMSLLGAEMKSTSLESLFSGGVSFATPDTGRELAQIAPEHHVFTLHGEAEKDWLRWQPRIPLPPRDETPAAPGDPAPSPAQRILGAGPAPAGAEGDPARAPGK